jgi:hypothetical protein
MNHAIIEGPDGSGKSTLIETLGLKRLHTVAFKPEYGDPMQFYCNRVGDAVEPTGFDRLWLSEIIYGPMLRTDSAITESQARTLKSVCAIPVVVCLPPFDVTLDATRSRPWPDYQTDEFLKRAYARFKLYADSTLVDYVFDWYHGVFRPSRGIPLVLLPIARATQS